MREKYRIRDNDFLTFDAVRQAAQCMGRVIRRCEDHGHLPSFLPFFSSFLLFLPSLFLLLPPFLFSPSPPSRCPSKTDYGVVVLADSRYNRQDKRSKLPPWIVQFIRESSLNLSTDVAVDQIRAFLKVAGQPIDQQALNSILFDETQVRRLAEEFKHTAFLPMAAVVAAPAPFPLQQMQHRMEVEVPPAAAVVEQPVLDEYEELYQREMENIGAMEEEVDVEEERVWGALETKPVKVEGGLGLELPTIPTQYSLPTYPTSLFLFDDVFQNAS